MTTASWFDTFNQQWLTTPGSSDLHRVEDEAASNRFFKLFAETKAPFNRQSMPGHLTASAIILNRGLDRVLLTHHRKLDKWLQLGGHADDDENLARVALREAEEESGLRGFHFVTTSLWRTAIDDLPMPFDLDVHEIPARKAEPLHYHHDVRFLLVADSDDPNDVVVSEESHDVRWFDLNQAVDLNRERSMVRQFEKVAILRNSTEWGLMRFQS